MNLTHAHVRHLYWSINSQTLAYVSGSADLRLSSPLNQSTQPSTDVIAAPSEEFNAWFATLDQQPDALEAFIAAHEHRLLGSYFEVLWQFFLSHYPNWSLLGSRVQIPPNGPTLGELDLLAKAPSGETLHIELAVKFYLRHPQRSGENASDWLGPQTRDRLDLKLDKLAEKQFPLLHHPVTQTTLEQAGLPTSAQATSVIKGYLFEPAGEGAPQEMENPPELNAIPPAVNGKVHTGYWYHHQHTDTLLSQHDQWAIIDKWQWLGPYRHNQTPLNAAEVKAFFQRHFRQPSYALMLIKLQAVDDYWEEQQRFMIVAADWPYLNKG